jgi:hypothetical protein
MDLCVMFKNKKIIFLLNAAIFKIKLKKAGYFNVLKTGTKLILCIVF